MYTSCWNDISMERCKEIVESCGGEKAFAENSVWSFNTRETINCLASHKDVNLLKVVHPDEVVEVHGQLVAPLQLSRLHKQFEHDPVQFLAGVEAVIGTTHRLVDDTFSLEFFHGV